jgi:hypothetical protein
MGPDERKRVMDWESIKRTGKPDPRSVDERTGTTRIVPSRFDLGVVAT